MMHGDIGSARPKKASFAPIRRSPHVLILDVALLRLRSKHLCGLVLVQNLPFSDRH